jgi:aminopeptidase N
LPGENLTRKEAKSRARDLTTRSYVLDIDLSQAHSSDTFRTRATIRFLATSGRSTFIDALAHSVHAVSLNGRELAVDEVFDGSRIALEGLDHENELFIDADFSYTNTGEGLHKFVDPVDAEVYLYSQFEVPDSRRVFPVFEQPDLKATFEFRVHTPRGWTVVSNQATPSALEHDDSLVFSFSPTPRISSYITALIAGPYQVVRDELTSANGKVVPLGIYARQSLFAYLDADYLFDITKKGFAYFEEKFSYPYPFDKYDQLFVPEFNAGAMENAGAVTFTENYVFRGDVSDAMRERRVVTVLHELAHMWFGDLVTMRWWNDLWLNESFAEWASTIATAEATEWTEAWTTFQAMEKNWAYRQDQLPSTHPIVATINDLEDVQVNFDGITYAKGGSVLKQLAAWVGRDAFFQGVSNYFQKHAWLNTELRDLLAELEVTSGRELSSWSKKWLETAGVNTLRPELSVDAEGVITSFAIIQSAPEDWPTLRPHRLAIGIYSDTAHAVERVHRIECDVDGARTDIPELIGVPRGDMIIINDDDLAYAKIRLDQDSESFARDNLSSISSPLARSLVWSATWDATRDGEMAARDFRRLILANIETETESTTIRTVLGQLRIVSTVYADPATVSGAQREVADRLWEMTLAATPGSDNQFQFLKAFAQMATSAEHADILRALRSGSTVLPERPLDTDLHWDVLGGLVLLGEAGADDIEAQRDGDNTSNGHQAAARLHAMIPSAEAKADTFHRLITDDTVPNALVRAATLGYTHVGDPSVLADLVTTYFDALDTIWESRSYKMAEYLVEGLFPSPLASAALEDACVKWLNEHEGPAALRRMVEENLAGVIRARKAQQRDLSAA